MAEWLRTRATSPLANQSPGSYIAARPASWNVLPFAS
jgi:hypothetical protein